MTALRSQAYLAGSRGSFGRVHMLEAVERLPGGKYRCVCDCGNERIVNVGHFNTGSIKSCGCHKGWHGQHRTRAYQAWGNMKARCHNPRNKRYADYGGKGILVCERWHTFAAFFEDMGECPDGYTIDREDNTKGYSPDNCHWVSRSDNQANRSVSRRWTVDGIEYPTAVAAAAANGVTESSIHAWCLGREAEGRWYPPRANCSARQLYVDGRKVA